MSASPNHHIASERLLPHHSKSPSPPNNPNSRGASIPPVSLTRSVAACALYGVTSVSITFFNKAVFSIYAFNFPLVLALVQILISLATLTAASFTGHITLPPVSLTLAKQIYPLATCWFLYVVSGVAALRYMTIPMFSTLRKFTAVIVLALEAVMLGQRARPSVWLSVLVMVFGGLVAGVNDLSFSLLGYFFVAVCALATALYLVLIVRVGKRTKLDSFGLLFYNNLLSYPLVMLCLAFTGEATDVFLYPHLLDFGFLAFLFLSAAQATVLNLAIFLCTNINSPLATTVTGQMKDFVTIGFGLFVFGDVKLNGPNLIGLAISLSGSLIYSVIKFLHCRQAARGKALPQSE